MEEEIRRRKEGVPSVKTKREAAEGGRRHAEGVKAKFEWGGDVCAPVRSRPHGDGEMRGILPSGRVVGGPHLIKGPL